MYIYIIYTCNESATSSLGGPGRETWSDERNELRPELCYLDTKTS